MSLPESLQSFAQGPAEITLAKALSYDRAGGLALVAALAGDKLRSHLEALGEVASDKEVKKAARAAAYKLKSAGVSGGVQREAMVDLSVKVETEGIAAATAPGFDGRLWLVLPSLPGAGGGELDLREANLRIDPIQELSLGRVRKFHHEINNDNVLQAPFLVNLDMATHLVGLADEALQLSGKPVPPRDGALPRVASPGRCARCPAGEGVGARSWTPGGAAGRRGRHRGAVGASRARLPGGAAVGVRVDRQRVPGPAARARRRSARPSS